MNKKLSWIVAILAVLIAGYFIFVGPKDQKDTNTSSPVSQQASDNNDASGDIELTIGKPSAPRTIVEFGDYKCPNCTRFHTGTYQELKTDYLDTGKAKLVFRNLPYIAADSRVAADGTYCANEQGLFEEYHEMIYDYIANLYDTEGLGKETEDVLTVTLLSGIIDDAGGDKQKFADCLNKGKYKASVDADLQSSEDNSVSGTPTFIIGGEKIISAQPISTFRTLLEAN